MKHTLDLSTLTQMSQANAQHGSSQKMAAPIFGIHPTFELW